ncbi:MAG: hypothetical protein AAF721_37865, partial [Myxococcota bacterium]
PARVLLLSLGALAGGAAAGVLFALGDRLAPGDPAVVLVGTGGVAGVGALAGMLLGRLGGDRPAHDDRIRPATGALSYGLRAPAQLDERSAHSMALRIAPTWNFAENQGRVRLLAHVGGLLAPRTDVDPRPQLAMPIEGQGGTAPVALRRRATSIGVGLDWAVRLPYPVLSPRRSAFLGPSEIRWKPDVQIRRDVVDAGRPAERVVSRTMLLPLTVGMRWHLSPRQRFTLYLGPRLDFVAHSLPGSDTLARGRAQLGPLYGEAWYDLDVPLTEGRRRDGRARRTESNGQLSLGYTHSRFDGEGFNLGPVVGFLGPLHAQWHTRIRPVGSAIAWQATAAVAIGSGLSMTASVGIVAPDISTLARNRRPRP